MLLLTERARSLLLLLLLRGPRNLLTVRLLLLRMTNFVKALLRLFMDAHLAKHIGRWVHLVWLLLEGLQGFLRPLTLHWLALHMMHSVIITSSWLPVLGFRVISIAIEVHGRIAGHLRNFAKRGIIVRIITKVVW